MLVFQILLLSLIIGALCDYSPAKVQVPSESYGPPNTDTTEAHSDSPTFSSIHHGKNKYDYHDFFEGSLPTKIPYSNFFSHQAFPSKLPFKYPLKPIYGIPSYTPFGTNFGSLNTIPSISQVIPPSLGGGLVPPLPINPSPILPSVIPKPPLNPGLPLPSIVPKPSLNPGLPLPPISNLDHSQFYNSFYKYSFDKNPFVFSYPFNSYPYYSAFSPIKIESIKVPEIPSTSYGPPPSSSAAETSASAEADSNDGGSQQSDDDTNTFPYETGTSETSDKTSCNSVK